MRCHHEAKLGLAHYLLMDVASDLHFTPEEMAELPPQLAEFFDASMIMMLKTASLIENVGEVHRAYVHSHDDGHAGESAMFTQELIDVMMKAVNEYMLKHGSALPPAEPDIQTGGEGTTV